MKLGDKVRPREEYRPHADFLTGTILAIETGLRDGAIHLDLLLDGGDALGGVPAREWQVVTDAAPMRSSGSRQ
jgi:hypothetical protein